MAYFNQTPVAPYQQPYSMTAPNSMNIQSTQTPQPNTFVWVSGEQAARSYPIAPGATVLMMDSEAQTFYIKKADASGRPFPLEIYDFAPRAMQQQSAPQVESNFVKMEDIDRIVEEKVNAALANRNKNKGGNK